jgi:histone deacetylase 3
MYEFGSESGRYYSINVPLKEGIDDTSMYISYCMSSIHHCISSHKGQVFGYCLN